MKNLRKNSKGASLRDTFDEGSLTTASAAPSPVRDDGHVLIRHPEQRSRAARGALSKDPVQNAPRSGAPISRRALCTLALGAAAAATFGLAGCGGDAADSAVSSDTIDANAAATEPLSTTLFVFDTVVDLTLYCTQETLDATAERCNWFEQHFSRTVEGSDVWNINHAGGEPVEVAAETADIIQKARAYSEASGGKFDITIGAVSSLWDFKEGVKPDDASIQAALPHIDYTKVKVEGTTVTLEDPDAMIDLGAIAKGYIADDLKSFLQERGVQHACINLGGNVLVFGGKLVDGEQAAWNVGIQDPNDEEGATIAKISGTDISVVTSGLYERQFTQDGTLYYHILDPKTGYPVKTDLVSSSVVSELSVDGDCYATIMFLLGHKKALEFLNEREGFEGMVVDTDGTIAQSSGSELELL